jgi:Domain of unknown function (DUF5658)
VSPLWQEIPRSLVLVALAIVCLNLFDVVLTLRHLELGAVEINPLMQQLIERGSGHFAAGKHFLVGAGVLALTTQCHHGAAVCALRFVLLPAYIALALYQVALLSMTPAL